MSFTPEEARRLAEQTEYPTRWIWKDGPNPIVGEYVDDAQAETRFGNTKRIIVLRDVDGKRWSVWLLGQLDVQWDEAEPKPKHGDLVSVWVRPGDLVRSAGGHEYRPSKIVVKSKDGSAPPAVADALPGPLAQDRARGDGAEPEPSTRGELVALLKERGQWPPTQAQVDWIKGVGYQAALDRLAKRGA